jgi:hypothetical protein
MDRLKIHRPVLSLRADRTGNWDFFQDRSIDGSTKTASDWTIGNNTGYVLWLGPPHGLPSGKKLDRKVCWAGLCTVIWAPVLGALCGRPACTGPSTGLRAVYLPISEHQKGAESYTPSSAAPTPAPRTCASDAYGDGPGPVSDGGR